MSFCFKQKIIILPQFAQDWYRAFYQKQSLHNIKRDSNNYLPTTIAFFHSYAVLVFFIFFNHRHLKSTWYCCSGCNIIKWVLWHSTEISQEVLHPEHMFGNYILIFTTTPPKVQWVNVIQPSALFQGHILSATAARVYRHPPWVPGWRKSFRCFWHVC